MLARLATATLVFAALIQTGAVSAAPPKLAAERLARRNARYAREREARRRPDRGQATGAPERIFGAAQREADVEVVYYADAEDEPIHATSSIGYAYAAPPLVFPTWSYGFGWGRPYYVGWYAPLYSGFYGGFHPWGYRGCWHAPWGWFY